MTTVFPYQRLASLCVASMWLLAGACSDDTPAPGETEAGGESEAGDETEDPTEASAASSHEETGDPSGSESGAASSRRVVAIRGSSR